MTRFWNYSRRCALISLIVLGLGGAIAPGGVNETLAQTETGGEIHYNHPFQGHNLVYVQSNDQWREARILSYAWEITAGEASWYYTVRYLDAAGGTENNISAERMLTVEQAQAQGVTAIVYDVSTPAGIEQMLAAHNQIRRQVGVPDLTWSEELAALAQDWANYLLQENLFQHRPPSQRDGGKIGENLSSSVSSTPGAAIRSPHRAVQGWIEERQHYDYASNTCTSGEQCGHYTQMVWDDTREVGCAVARNETRTREVWVCNYTPGGNFVGQRPY